MQFLLGKISPRITTLVLAILIVPSRAFAAPPAPYEIAAPPVVYGHTVDLSTVPASRGNGTLFTGSVCWMGILGSGGCFPGFGNDVSQIAFKGGYAVPPASHWHLSYRYRCDCEPDFDVTYVIIEHSGQCLALQPTGNYAFTGPRSQRDTVASYTGSLEGTDDVDLSGYSGMTICVEVNSVSNATNSDFDCGYPSRDGLFEFDNIQIGSDLTTFDSNANGWTFGAVGPVVSVTAPGSGLASNVALAIALAITSLGLIRRRSRPA